VLEHGANPSAANVFGITAVHGGCGRRPLVRLVHRLSADRALQNRGGAVETMKLLVAAGAKTEGRTTDLSLGYQRARVAGLTAAHGAAFQGWPEVIQYLYDLGLDVNAKQTSPTA
jgi:hypothetical protein